MHTLLIIRRGPRSVRARPDAPSLRDGRTPDGVRWIRSYVLDEDDGAGGPVSIYRTSGS